MVLVRSHMRIARRAPETPFFDVEAAPPDPILGLGAAFAEDPSSAKVNLGVGVYLDGAGVCPLFPSIEEAERRIHARKAAKTYIPMGGLDAFVRGAQDLVLPTPQSLGREALASVQTLGGTGALRLAAELCAHACPEGRVWVTEPTWPNHRKIFREAGLEVLALPYLDPTGRAVDASRLLDALDKLGPNNVVVLHGCCHNPTGVDPDVDTWRSIAEVARRRRWLPLLDVAYSGFGDGLDEDLRGVRALVAAEIPMLIAYSFSKVFGLYGERVGALHAFAGESARVVRSQLERLVRSSYSSPPSHGARLAAELFEDAQLLNRWRADLEEARVRVGRMRVQLRDALHERLKGDDFSHLTLQKGMFGVLGLEPAQVERLRAQWSIYLPSSGRINFAGLTSATVDRVADGLTAVLAR